MTTITQTLIRAATRGDDEPLNILTFPTHERYQSNMAQTGHNFYLWQGLNIKPWKEEYAPVPKNHVLLNPDKLDKQIPPYVDIDLILSQNKFGQFQVAQEISRQIRCPLVSIEHTLPMDSWSKAQLIQMRYMKGKINLFISEYSRGKWGWSEKEADIIHHGIDTDLFKPVDGPRDNRVLSVVNDWINRDWCCGYKIWEQVTGYPKSDLRLQVFGDTPGLSTPAPSPEALASEYANSRVFLNTSTVSPIPTALLEAMASGCAVVSTSNCMIPEIVEHGINGYLSNDPAELRAYVIHLLQDNTDALRVGAAARQTILDRFSLRSFVDGWNDVFRKALE
jgi:hypothetical protein